VRLSKRAKRHEFFESARGVTYPAQVTVTIWLQSASSNADVLRDQKQNIPDLLNDFIGDPSGSRTRVTDVRERLGRFRRNVMEHH